MHPDEAPTTSGVCLHGSHCRILALVTNLVLKVFASALIKIDKIPGRQKCRVHLESPNSVTHNEKMKAVPQYLYNICIYCSATPTLIISLVYTVSVTVDLFKRILYILFRLQRLLLYSMVDQILSPQWWGPVKAILKGAPKVCGFWRPLLQKQFATQNLSISLQWSVYT